MNLPDAGTPLDSGQAARVFAALLDGQVADTDAAMFLRTLAARGETVDEVVAAATSLRARAATIEAPADAIDVCGTGGDGRHTLNISTAVAIVVASLGVPVAKHGNRAASSKSGAADVLAALGVDTDLSPARAEACLGAVGICFLHAARYHAAMARVAGVRRALGQRTIFNLLGPLANPAGVRRQLVGVYAPQWVAPMADSLRRLGSIGLVVHGQGLDELTVNGPSEWAHTGGGTGTVAPADAGLPVHDATALTGGDAATNARALTALLDGAPGAYRDIVLLNAAAALRVAGRAAGWLDGAVMAAGALDDGRAADLLARWRDFR